ncbi:MAG TPA: 50S ribosomal protein L35 [Gaiellaceae bacterium]|jgi:large subunit ribosomal protein L35|nr:50S ribosomal protein L35 [Gaiellaceae bacterium]
MPKQKTNSGAKKKFKVTGSGKLLRRPANQSHNLEHKPAKQKRAFSKNLPVAPANERAAKKLLGKG